MIALLWLAAAISVQDVEASVARREAALVQLRRDLHSNPELSNREYRTGKLVAERLRSLGLEVRHPVAKTGVVAVLRGASPGRVVAVRADLDALPIEEKGERAWKSTRPGVMHACGHDVHTTVALGAAEVLSEMRTRLAGTVVFLFQPAEEGVPVGEEGGAAAMLAERALDEPRVEAIFGLHVDPLLDAGRVGWSGGAVFASSDGFTVEVVGKRTHGAYPHTGVDAVPVAAEIVLALQGLVAREGDALKPKVLSIGTIHGGERPNIVAQTVRMEGTLRVLDDGERVRMKRRMGELVEGIASAHGAKASVSYRGAGLPALKNAPALATAARRSLERSLGAEAVVDVEAQMAAEDFALFAQRVPAFYWRLGVRNEAKGITAMMHTESFDVDEAAIGVGVRAMVGLVLDTLAAR